MSKSFKLSNSRTKFFQRSIFEWINQQFNAVDYDRRKEFGPDRTCAEWILRNGGAVKWTTTPDLLNDYNKLPKEGTPLAIEEIDATDSSIMHYGFEHFNGCTHIKKIIFNQCDFLEDKGFESIGYLKNSLQVLQISNCPNISEKGLIHLGILKKLRVLYMFNLINVKDKAFIVKELQKLLPQCTITFK